MYAGTLLLIGGKDCRYAKMLFRSSSVICPMNCQGIGGIIGLPASAPINFPVRSILINNSSVHAPLPVALSGVRLAEKETPHGPTHEVRSLLAKYHLPGVISVVSMRCSLPSAGEPESRRVSSMIGPCGVMILGVWQSLQLAMVVKYFPRSIICSLVSAGFSSFCVQAENRTRNAAAE